MDDEYNVQDFRQWIKDYDFRDWTNEYIRDQLGYWADSFEAERDSLRDVLAGFAKPGLEFDNEGVCVYCDIQWIEDEPPPIERHKSACYWRRANELLSAQRTTEGAREREGDNAE